MTQSLQIQHHIQNGKFLEASEILLSFAKDTHFEDQAIDLFSQFFDKEELSKGGVMVKPSLRESARKITHQILNLTRQIARVKQGYANKSEWEKIIYLKLTIDPRHVWSKYKGNPTFLDFLSKFLKMEIDELVSDIIRSEPDNLYLNLPPEKEKKLSQLYHSDKLSKVTDLKPVFIRTIRDNKIHIRDMDLSFTNLENADFTGEYMPNVNLKGANLLNATFSGVDMEEAIFAEANMEDADLENTILTGADFFLANLKNTNFQEAELLEAILEETNLENTNFEEASLMAANLNKASLKGANLQDADLLGASLTEANLSNTDLRGANLEETDLKMANLQGVELEGTSLDGAEFYGAIAFESQRDEFLEAGADIMGMKFD